MRCPNSPNPQSPTGHMNQLLINYHDAFIYSSDLALLDHQTAWLNDACIHFQLTRLSMLRREERIRHRPSQQWGSPELNRVETIFLDP